MRRGRQSVSLLARWVSVAATVASLLGDGGLADLGHVGVGLERRPAVVGPRGLVAGVAQSVDELGYVDHCEHCLYREATRGLIADPLEACPNCDHGIQTGGPIWLGPTRDVAFTEAVREYMPDHDVTKEVPVSHVTLLAKTEDTWVPKLKKDSEFWERDPYARAGD